MNPPIEDSRTIEAGRQAEATLRLIARLPAPGGLEDRVRQALSKAPPAGRVLAWRVSRERWSPEGSRERWMQSSFARGAAAAAIVLAVGGGGWGVYSRVHPAQTQRVIVMPLRVGVPGGFSSAGAMRTPQTLNRPVITHPALTPTPAPPVPAQPVLAQPALTPVLAHPETDATKPQPASAAASAVPHPQRKHHSATQRHPHAKATAAPVAVQQ